MRAALESIDAVSHIFDDNTKMAFITAGLGGGTGTPEPRRSWQRWPRTAECSQSAL